jgi:predicted glycogen debranching enzyme
MQFSKKVKFVFDPLWYKGIEYRHDMEDGFPYKEDLYVPGYFELPIRKGETIVFSAGDKKSVPSGLLRAFEEGVKIRTPRSSFYNCMKNSGHQFYYRPAKNELYLLEGYPWFGVDARAQFISLPGLTLCIDRDEAFEEVIDSAIPAVDRFMKGEPVTGLLKGMDEPDVLLWIVWALGKFAHKYREHCCEKYGQLVSEIVDFILQGKHERLEFTESGLLYTNGREIPATWMNATAMGAPVVPRTGFIVEINALWYNALMLRLDMCRAKDDAAAVEKLTALTGKVKTAFNETFVNGYGYLFDYVDGNYLNWSVRPNMLIALSADYSPLDRNTGKSVLDIVTKELLTPKGIRTLSPKSEGYSPYYQGTQYEKDYAAFNGTAYPWLLSHYVDSYLKVFQRSGIFFIDRIVGELEEEMANDCIGSLSQLYDGNPPYTGHSASSYAMNVAGTLSVLSAAKKFDNDFKDILI